MAKYKTPYYTLIDIELLGFIKRIARAVVKQFNLKYRSISLMENNDNMFLQAWAYCCDKDIVIKIKLHEEYMSITDIIDTVLHELAHLDDGLGEGATDK